MGAGPDYGRKELGRILWLGLLAALMLGSLIYLSRLLWANSAPHKVWQSDLPSGGNYSQDILADGLYQLKSDDSSIRCFSLDGSLVWEYQAPAPSEDYTSCFQQFPGAISLAMTDGRLALLRTADGTPLSTLDTQMICAENPRAGAGAEPAQYLVQSASGSWGLGSNGGIVWTRPDLLSVEPPVRVQQLRGGLIMAASQKGDSTRIVALNPDGTTAWQYRPLTRKPPGPAGIGGFYFDASGSIYGELSWLNTVAAPPVRSSISADYHFSQDPLPGLIFRLDANGQELYQHSAVIRYGDYLYPLADGTVVYCEAERDLVCLDASGHQRWRNTYPGGIGGFTACLDGPFYVETGPDPAASYSPAGVLQWLPFVMQRQNRLPCDLVVVVGHDGKELHRWQLRHYDDWLTAALPEDRGFITCEVDDAGAAAYGPPEHVVCYHWR